MPNEESWLNKVFFASDNSVNKVSGKNKEVASNSSGAQNAEFVFEFENDDSYDTVNLSNNKNSSQENKQAKFSTNTKEPDFVLPKSYGLGQNNDLSTTGATQDVIPAVVTGAIDAFTSAANTIISEFASMADIKQAIQDKTAEIEESQASLSEAQSGTHPEISALKEAEDAAFEEYQNKIAEKSQEDAEALSAAKEKVDSTKQSLDEMETNIKQKEGEIESAEARIQDCESKITTIESSISSLESAIASAGEDEDTSSLETRLATAKNELAKAKAEKQEAQEQKTELTYEKGRMVRVKGNQLEPKYSKACKELEEIEKKYENDEDIKPLKEAYEKAKEATEAKKTELTEKIQGEIDTKRGELDKLNSQLAEVENKGLENKYAPDQEFNFDFEENMSEVQKSSMDLFKQNYEENKDKYQEVAKATGMPPELIAAIHWREASGDFDKYLHNGQPLGQTTTIVPKGIYFEDWTEAAIDAIAREMPKMENSEYPDGSLDYYLDYAERYNGTGYRDRGVPSPYIWAGTTNYSSGKYVEDGKYDPNHVDQQLGVALMLKALMA